MDERQTTTPPSPSEGETPIHTVRFQLDRDTYTQLNQIFLGRTRKRRRLTTSLLAIGLSIVLCLVRQTNLPTMVVTLVLVLLILWPFSSLLEKLILRMNAKRSEALSPAHLETQSYEFFDEGFRISSPKTSSFIRYDKITTLARSDDYIAMFISDVNAYMVNGECSDCGLPALTEFLQRKTGKPIENHRTK